MESEVEISGFCEKIGLGEEEIRAVCACLKKRPRLIRFLCAVYGRRRLRSGLNKYPYIVRLTIVLILAEKAHAQYVEKGISDEIYYDTFGDIAVWAENCKKLHGAVGLENVNWINNHLNLQLFKLGRLQYQFSKFRLYPDYRKTGEGNLPKNGTPALFMHIPRGERLEIGRCRQSVIEAKDFFAKFYPDYNYRLMFTNTWLLYPKNAEFLPKKSNIRDFMSLFDVVADKKHNKDAFTYMWYGEGKNPESFSEDTSLRVAAKRYSLDGNSFGMGLGILKDF